MDNPFKKRRTELITDRRTMLSLVSPTPIEEFFRIDRDQVIDKLTMVVGTPGCGKTTIAQVVEFESLAALCTPDAHQVNKDLLDVLTLNRFVADGVPALIGHRLSMTTNFRDIWELPYPEHTRTALLRAFVQSKAVLGWFRQLDGAGISLEDVDVVMGEGADSVIAVTGAERASEFRRYARDIELAIFRIVTSLVPPDEQEMANEFINTSYDVFEVLKGFTIKRWPRLPDAPEVSVRPLLIIDDAHELHPEQFVQLRDWLKSKAIGISRWLMCRPDVVAPEDYREAMKEDAAEENLAPGSTRGRDYLMKLMQLNSRDAKRFKPIAKDIANRYIAGIPEFSRRGVRDLRPTLEIDSATLPDGQLRQLRESVENLAKESKFGPALVDALKARISPSAREDEALAALRILLHRERNRTPQMGLLPEDSLLEEPVTDDRMVAASLIEGARIQLLEQFERPFYYGMDKLIAASNANIEQFIRLSGVLVDELLARMIRGRTPGLSARSQHKALVAQARQTIREWDFPYHAAVRELVSKIALRCRERTLLPNAPLNDGANAIGVPQDEMDDVLNRSERLARVLHFAFAYKALVFVPQYRCKNKVWCLLELGALPCMAHGLTLSRGGFIEETLTGVQSMLAD
ncbi:hypothetical protein [Paraburkholderia caribensis]|uniref:hypothetical protein n=1 Tax=Paraburkholderia caribensis TaxID=75105 RepID=UPI00078C7B07|nr:hypothetical protein [Paraburkholderia caribensis]AMV44336.1 hypothetical protein ATN79_20550 [Paraburkholderia caribensis]